MTFRNQIRSGRVFFICAVVLTALAGDTHADVRLPALFADHAVLQRDWPLPVWGWADAGEKVQVTLGKQSAEAMASEDGRWQVTLKSMRP